MKAPSRNTMIGFAIKLLCLVILLPLSFTLRAQSFYGSVLGTVTDTSGGVVDNATVTVTNTGTNESVQVQTDASGQFSVMNLVPAVYKLEVSKANYKHFLRERVEVQVGSTVRIDSALQVGNTSETVVVSTAPPLLQTDSSSMSQEISGDQVQQMPLNGRNVMNLIGLAAGVVPGGSATGGTGLNQGTRTAGGAGWGNYQIGGAIQGQSAQYIDGVPNNVLGGNPVALVPTQDAIQEFSVASSNAGADFGRFGGGVVNMTTKSGTNNWHGSAYEYFRNAALNANDFFSNQVGSARAKWNQNQFGVVANGPIKRDKAFFLFTWEKFAAITGQTTPTNVPTLDLQNGIFTTAITDPLGNCNIVHDPIAKTWTITNLYQGNCGDPMNKILKTYYPAPNSSGASNWFKTSPIANHQNQYNGRVDYTISPKQRFFGRYTYWALQDGAHSEFGDKGLGGVPWPTADGHVINDTHQVVLGDTYAFNSTTALDVRVNFVRETFPNYPDSVSVDESQFGPAYAALSKEMSIKVLPAFNASGIHNLYNLGNFTGYSINWYNTYGTNVNLIKVIGAHSLKLGTELRLMDSSGTNFDNQGAGQYQYSTKYTGDEWASFLMGYPTQIAFKTISNVAGYSYYQAYYLTDTWQATRKLTLNLGLRYELPGGVAERNNKNAVFLPNAVDPYTGITGTLALTNSSLYHNRNSVVPEHNLFAPRVGFAYRAEANTVIHGGYGVSYLPNDLSVGVMPYNSLVNAAGTQVNITGALPTPLQTALQGLVKSGINQPIGRSDPSFMTQYGSRSTYLGQNVSGPIPYQSYPYVQQWNFAVSHEFKGDWMAEIGYSGLKGTNLPGMSQFGSGRNIDELSSNFYSLGEGLLTVEPCGKANGEMMTVGQCNRPFPYYNNVQDTAQFYAKSNYKSVQAKAEKRFGAAGVVMANYTWSKNLGNTDTQNDYLENKATLQGGNGTGQIQDYNNLQGEYSFLSYNVTGRAVVSYVLNLPFGKGQKFANSVVGPANALISGWAVNGITTFQTGFPVFFATASPNLLTSSFGAGLLRPNVVPGCNKVIGGSGLSRAQAGGWFNTSCYVFPTSASDPNGLVTFGNEPRADPDIRADGIKNFDFAMQKSTTLHEGINLEFRTEFFNLFNRVQFSPPVSTLGAGNFGAILYQANKPRQIQASLRVNF